MVDSISIHALREEGDGPVPQGGPHHANFYPRPPRGGRHYGNYHRGASQGISIHALREEGDRCWRHPAAPRSGFLSTPSARRATWAGLGFRSAFVFLSTPSARRATHHCRLFVCLQYISIHALREEGDLPFSRQLPQHTNFYPRPPRGGRPHQSFPQRNTESFLSTPSARRATLGGLATLGGSDISIHALREEGDADVLQQLGIHPISIHALREEGDTFSASITRFLTYFYPRPPRGGRLEAAGFGQPFF